LIVRLHARRARAFVAAALVLVAASVGTAAVARPAAAVTHAQINGAGSTWAGNALNAWIGQVAQNGLRVTFTGTGSAQGRQYFAAGTVDYGVSDIGYQGSDPRTGLSDTSSRPYAFVPLVAGGTAFPYNIVAQGKRVTSLRLSGLTLAKIFTNQITNWDDPAITADNNGATLPSIPIIPVVHSEGSGTSYQFSAYLNQEFPSIWSSFNGDGSPTEYWPTGKGQQIAQNGSDGVMNYVASSSGQGTITFDEYSYAIAKSFPVAKILNAAGFYTLPTQYNVAVALTQAIINQDKSDPTKYLLQDLHNVYGYTDPRTYPMSSYSYGIIPTSSTDSTMSTGKRQTLADFLFQSVCQGQGTIGPIGYSALPINLVQAAFDQIGLLGQADPNVDLTNENVANCGNPTFVAGNPNDNHLADIAPQPLSCDKQGQGPCGANVAAASPSSSASTSSSASANPSTGTTAKPTGAATAAAHPTAAGGATQGANPAGGVGSTSGANPTGATDATTGANSTGGAASQAPSYDPVTGALVGAPSQGTTDVSTGDDNGQPATVAATTLAAGQGSNAGLAVLASLLVVAAIIGPPFLSRRWRRERPPT
jgi:phosphate transport system substrate-binding protein